MRLVLATHNQGKLKELSIMLKDLPFELASLAAYPELPPVVEDGETFLSNAVKKACTICRATHELTLADDSGLAVDALGGAPGVFSARFAGSAAGDGENNQKLLTLLQGVPEGKRSACFHAVIALAFPDGRVYTVEGSCSGEIGLIPRGQDGFGYDPLFYLPEFSKTFAELDAGLKNRISHRGRALVKAIQLLTALQPENN